MENDDSFKRLSGNKMNDRKYTSLSNSKNNSSYIISSRHRRKSHLSSLVARKQNKNSYQLSHSQKLEIINQQALS